MKKVYYRNLDRESNVGLRSFDLERLPLRQASYGAGSFGSIIVSYVCMYIYTISPMLFNIANLLDKIIYLLQLGSDPSTGVVQSVDTTSRVSAF